ncbi:hypothetical protein HNP81_002121 [Peribacillus huizhouensis]|uniref:Uncharacterized protein n=1 Tax=Peribacillus huizhouensis TaxID=1501239 RepID=A0ABR6CP72_9BACI|nr:hypothetical protein [Peribacillus huizhouensis]
MKWWVVQLTLFLNDLDEYDGNSENLQEIFNSIKKM